jgi:hypothetical protein
MKLCGLEAGYWLFLVPFWAASLANRAIRSIEQAEALGEHHDDLLLLFMVLDGFWVASFVGFNGDTARDLATQFLGLAEKQGAVVPLMIGHRLVGSS